MWTVIGMENGIGEPNLKTLMDVFICKRCKSTSFHTHGLIGRLLGPFSFVKAIFIGCSSGGARGVMVIVVGNGHGDTSSNPGPD